MASRLTLEVTGGIHSGKRFTFADRKDVNVIVGRATNCDISIPGDIQLSRQHFMLKIRSDGMRICDLVSRNGTYVNGTRYGGLKYADASGTEVQDRCPQISLQDGDEIQAGGTRFRVRIAFYELCKECGTEIPESGGAEELGIDSVLACRSCRERLSGTALGESSSGRQRCRRCGKYLRITSDGEGKTIILCEPCQEDVDASPTILLQHLLKYISVHQVGEPLPQIKGFRIDRELGVCGFGAVYLARRIKDDAPVALKIMRAVVTTSGRGWKKIKQALMDISFRRGSRISGFFDQGAQRIKIHIAMKVTTGSGVERLLKDLPPDDGEQGGHDAAGRTSFLELDGALQAT
jgi:hypothetical protein